MAFEVGETVTVPIDVVITFDGVQQTIKTKGEDATVTQRLFDNEDPDTQEDIFTYLLLFPLAYDILNADGEVEITTSEFWFSEYELTGKEFDIDQLPISSQEINNQIKINRTTSAVNLAQGKSILNKVPKDDNTFRESMSRLVEILDEGNSLAGTVKYNPNLTSSVEQIISDLTGSTLKSAEGEVILAFLQNLNTQQKLVYANTQSLRKEETSSFSNVNKAYEADAKSTAKFFQQAQTAKGLEQLLVTANTYTPVDWQALDAGPVTPLPTDFTDAQKAAGLFPLLNTTTVTRSGLV